MSLGKFLSLESSPKYKNPDLNENNHNESIIKSTPNLNGTRGSENTHNKDIIDSLCKQDGFEKIFNKNLKYYNQKIFLNGENIFKQEFLDNSGIKNMEIKPTPKEEMLEKIKQKIKMIKNMLISLRKLLKVMHRILKN